MKTLQIGKHIVGENFPTYIIAEIGINHNGDENMAMQLIQEAANSGVDCVKFQKRDLSSLYPPDILETTEKFEQTFQYMIPLLKEVELKEESYCRLKKKCEVLGLDFLCTPFDKKSALFLHHIGCYAFKISSADLTNHDLVQYVADFGKPMILSTGMSHFPEITHAVTTLKNRDVDFALLHCRSVYPVWPREVNLRMISKLKQFNCPVGYSGHEVGITIPLVAASMGACIIEKHITLDKKQRGPDHKVSLTPYEFKRLVRDIRIADQAIGKTNRYLLRGEILNRELFGKSLVASQNIPEGTNITAEMVMTMGPGKGLNPQKIDKIIGTIAKRSIAQFDFFKDSDLCTHKTNTSITNTLKTNWGLIARFSDIDEMFFFKPKIIEFHLAEKDLLIEPHLHEKHDCLLALHAPEYMGDVLHDLASSDKSIRQKSVEHTIQSIELLKQISPYFNDYPKFITHPGAMSLNEKLAPEKLEENLYLSIQEILPECENIQFLLENLPPYPWYFGGQWKGNYFMEAEEIVSFCLKSEIKICFDLSHAALYCNAKDKKISNYIRTVLPFTEHIHFADAYGLDGEGMQIEEGDINLEEIMPLFSDYQGTWVPEVWRGHQDQGKGFLTALERLKKYGL